MSNIRVVYNGGLTPVKIFFRLRHRRRACDGEAVERLVSNNDEADAEMRCKLAPDHSRLLQRAQRIFVQKLNCRWVWILGFGGLGGWHRVGLGFFRGLDFSAEVSHQVDPLVRLGGFNDDRVEVRQAARSRRELPLDEEQVAHAALLRAAQVLDHLHPDDVP